MSNESDVERGIVGATGGEGLPMVKGNWKVVGAKLLSVVDVTFCSIPTNDANYRYLDRLTFGVSAARCKP